MKYALITGSDSGLGFELVREHLQAGFGVFALDINLSQALQALAQAHPEQLFVYRCDIGSTESVQQAIACIKKIAPHLDRIFNNAGIHRFCDWVTLEETELDFLPTMYNINAVGALRIVKAALPLLDSSSIIINTSSEAASLTSQASMIGYAYAMSKAGMNMGARLMDNWLRPQGIRTIMIHPGRMRTAMKGDHSNIDPWETSSALMQLLENFDQIPEEQRFIDYHGNPLPW